VRGKNRALRGALTAGLITRWLGRKLARAGSETGIGTSAQQRARWERQNHRGETVTLFEGPAIASGLVAGALVAGGTARTKIGSALAVSGAGVFGVIDDLAEQTEEKGLRGHVGALARGKVTTGGLKILGIGAASLAAATLARGPGDSVRDVLSKGALIATSANLANLFDLRPGRVLKVSAAAGLPLALTSAESGLAGAVVGSSLAAAPEDLGEETMAGDGGANALGALVGSTIAFSAPRAVRESVLLGVIALTAASERWSFSKFIDNTPWLRAVDGWGRRR